MSNKGQLSKQRKNTVINKKSKKEDKLCVSVVKKVMEDVTAKHKVNLLHKKRLYLTEIVNKLKESYTDAEFAQPSSSSYMAPDGGITYLLDKSGEKYPILIAEVKNQGTNDTRAKQGLKKQAKGNAVERLGKNVLGFKTYLLSESIFPFVCFGDGCDFAEGSTILDRVRTIAMFGELNTDHTANKGTNGLFNRGSYYFRVPDWTFEEMYEKLYAVAEYSVNYYFSKYGKEKFVDEK